MLAEPDRAGPVDLLVHHADDEQVARRRPPARACERSRRRRPRPRSATSCPARRGPRRSPRRARPTTGRAASRTGSAPTVSTWESSPSTGPGARPRSRATRFGRSGSGPASVTSSPAARRSTARYSCAGALGARRVDGVEAQQLLQHLDGLGLHRGAEGVPAPRRWPGAFGHASAGHHAAHARAARRPAHRRARGGLRRDRRRAGLRARRPRPAARRSRSSSSGRSTSSATGCATASTRSVPGSRRCSATSSVPSRGRSGRTPRSSAQGRDGARHDRGLPHRGAAERRRLLDADVRRRRPAGAARRLRVGAAPGRVLPTGCGVPADDNAAFYCPADDTIYVAAALRVGDLQRRDPRTARRGARAAARSATSASPTCIAHEYAHNLQEELGIFTLGRAQQLQAVRAAGRLHGRRLGLLRLRRGRA